jgi:hypothetical protein
LRRLAAGFAARLRSTLRSYGVQYGVLLLRIVRSSEVPNLP